MAKREIDYYIKNLSLEARQQIFKYLDDLNPARITELLEKTTGYPSLKSMGYSDDDIAKILQQSANKFKILNDYMEENGRPPLFSNSNDTFTSAKEYCKLLEKKTPEKLKEIFGCTWDEYIPQIFKGIDEH